MREGIYLGLKELLKRNKNLIILDNDVGEATRTKKLKNEFENRIFNLGIVEQSTFGIAAGLSKEGFKVYIVMFSIFTLRGIEIIRQCIGYPNLDVVIIGSHAGVSVGEDGPTHQCIEDVACFRSLPNFSILSPADRNETISVIKESFNRNHPVYIRVARQQFGSIYESVPKFKSFSVIVDEGDDFTIIASGIEVYEALKAIEMLRKDRLKGKLINIVEIKPISNKILDFMTERVICVEDHNIIGGLYSGISEILVREDMKFKILPIGICDRYGKSGNPRDVLKYFGLDYYSIYKKVKKWLKYS